MAEDDKTTADLASLDERLTYLERIARETVARLYVIETRLGLAHSDPWVKQQPPAVPQQPLPPPRPAVPTPATLAGTAAPPQQPSRPSETTPPSIPPPTVRPASQEGRSVLGISPPSPASPQVPRPAVASSNTTYAAPPRKKGASLEVRIGGNWFNRIGVVAIILGVGFFFKYAYDSGWITKWGWVSIGLVLGIAFLVGGESTRRRYESYAFGLTGCGISLLYLSVFAAYRLFELVEQPVAFIAMAVVTAIASILSARYNALAIAVLGLIGGFLTPILLSTGHDNEVGLFGYITLLNLGVLSLAYSKRWRSLNYLSFGATVLTFIGWFNEFYASEKLWPTVLFLTIFFVIFAVLAVTYNVINQRPTTWLDLLLVFLNALLYFGTTYELLEEKYHQMLGAFAIVVAAFYMALGYLTYRRDREDVLLIHTFLGLAFLFSVLAVPIQFDQQWVTMAWAIEGAVMTWVGLRANDRVSRYAGLVVFVIAATHWFWIDASAFGYPLDRDFVPLWNRRALSCAVLVAALALAARLYHVYREQVDDSERSLHSSLYILGANAAAILLLSFDINDYFARKRDLGVAGPAEAWTNTRQFTLSALWTVYGVVMLMVGITRNQKVLRAMAAVLLGLTTLKVLAIDLAYHSANWHRTLLNETFASLAMLVFGFALSAWMYAKSNISGGERRVALPFLIVLANVLALIALTTEPIGYFQRAMSSAPQDELLPLNNSMHFTLSVIWTIYAAIAISIGFRRNSKSVRIGALLLLAFSTLKILLLDARFYAASWHRLLFNETFAAFAIVVGAMSLAIYLYSRSSDVEPEERESFVPVLMGAANFLAVVALSLEAIGYFKQEIRALRASHAPSVDILRLDNSMHFALTAIWVLYAAAALLIAYRRSAPGVRAGALLLLGLATIKVLLIDTGFYDSPWHSLVFNQTFGAFALVTAGLALAVYCHPASENTKGHLLRSILLVLANVMAIIGLSTEAFGHYAVLLNQPLLTPSATSDLKLAQQLWLTMIWTLYGGALLTVGIWRRNRMLRMMALLLLGVTIVKVFFVDLTFLAKLYRTISLLVLGGILLAVSFLYQRYRQRTSDSREEAVSDPAPQANQSNA